MHGSKATIEALVTGILDSYKPQEGVQVAVFPPAIYLPLVQALLQDKTLWVGAQNMSANEPGAYTGEIAATMLRDYECRAVLVGHSERRTLYHEDDVQVAMKFAQAKRHGLTPLLCVGETLEERQGDLTEQVIARQLDAVLNLEGGVDVFRHAVIAYEPVWAIGTGQTATPDQAQAVHHMIRHKLKQLNAELAEQIPLLYGGSMKAANAKALLGMPDIDGGLIGGASLDAHEFLEIIRCIN